MGAPGCDPALDPRVGHVTTMLLLNVSTTGNPGHQGHIQLCVRRTSGMRETGIAEGHELLLRRQERPQELGHSQPCSQAWREVDSISRCCGQGEHQPPGWQLCLPSNALTATFPHLSHSPRNPLKSQGSLEKVSQAKCKREKKKG